MQSHPQILEVLNRVLGIELTSINRYFLHARMFRNWGFERLNQHAYKKSIRDMKQADVLIERILFLEGLPNLQKLHPLKIGEHCEEMLQCDMHFQLDQVTQLKTAIALCESEKDYVSRGIFTDILEYEEAHVDWLESQLEQISKITLENYLQANISEGE